MRNSLLMFPPSELTTYEQLDLQTCAMTCSKCGIGEKATGSYLRALGWVFNGHRSNARCPLCSKCSVIGCDRKSIAKGMCGTHWTQCHKTGNPVAVPRFWRLVAITADPTRCWEWKGYVNEKGYGDTHYTVDGVRIRLAHRVSYAMTYGDPGELFVCHACDNPPCVNPAHLYLGTNQDNQNDRWLRQRGQREIIYPMCSQCGEAKAGSQAVLRDNGWVFDVDGHDFCPACSPYRSQNVCRICRRFSPRAVEHQACREEVATDMKGLAF